MADPEKQPPPPYEEPASQPPAEQSGGQGGGEIGPNMAYITSIPGILKFVEFLLLMIAFACGADATNHFIGGWGRMSFFLFVTVTSWLLVIVIVVLFALNVVAKINLTIDWNIPIMVFNVVVAVLLLISSSLLADDAATLSDLHVYLKSFLGKLRAAAAFGFISMFVFIGDAVVHFLKMQGKM